MRYRPFATTGLFVSEICLGTMTFGKGSTNVAWSAIGQLGAAEVERMLGAALDAGINFLDTADVYSGGQSEELVGEALRALGTPRDQVILATKVRGRTGPGPNAIGLSRGHIFSAVDASLRRLQTDYLDLYQIHGVDTETPIEETVRALDDLVRAGKVRYVGCSNLPAWLAMTALGWADAHHCARFVSAQVYYSLVGRDIERELVPLAGDQQLALLPWSPLAGGLLSGKYDVSGGGPEGARRTQFDFPPVDEDRLGRVLAALRRVAAESGVPVPRVSLAWILSRPFVTSVIIGAKTQAQFEDNLAATDVRLAPEHVALLDEASALPPEYPAWMVSWQGRSRLPQ